jgi:hypothetical protein
MDSRMIEIAHRREHQYPISINRQESGRPHIVLLLKFYCGSRNIDEDLKTFSGGFGVQCEGCGEATRTFASAFVFRAGKLIRSSSNLFLNDYVRRIPQVLELRHIRELSSRLIVHQRATRRTSHYLS